MTKSDAVFRDRSDAGRKLASLLSAYADRNDVLVLGIPRGGVSVAFEVAAALRAPLDVFVSRKLGVPWQEELAFGAVAGGGIRILDPEMLDALAIPDSEIDRITAMATKEVQRRERAYRGGKPALHLEGKIVILVDDGVATGSSIRAAIGALRQLNPARLVVAVPVAPSSACDRLRREVDECVCVLTPESFFGIGQFYEDFSQVEDAEVADLLRSSGQNTTQSA
jgi:putative phosphoribosyl transferase